MDIGRTYQYRSPADRAAASARTKFRTILHVGRHVPVIRIPGDSAPTLMGEGEVRPWGRSTLYIEVGEGRPCTG